MLDSPDPGECDDEEDQQVTIVRSVKNLNLLAKLLRYFEVHGSVCV